jgi:hypothetical protein
MIRIYFIISITFFIFFSSCQCIPDATVTVAELLKQAGYSTGIFGKWGPGVKIPKVIPRIRASMSFLDTIARLMCLIQIGYCSKISFEL